MASLQRDTVEFCRGWDAATNGGSNSGTTTTNTPPSNSQGHHTAAYNAGHELGVQDAKLGNGNFGNDACDSSDFQGIDHDHCIIGYNDGFAGH